MELFDIEPFLDGWMVWVNIPESPVCRFAKTELEAHKLLECLKKALVTNQGPTIPLVEAWMNGVICVDDQEVES